MKKALLLVDLQIDFLPGGALPVPEGDLVIPIANRLMEAFDLVVATQDWHPANHGSFAANHPWRKPGQVIVLDGLEQILWPIHCVQESFGAEFPPSLHADKINQVFRKGTDPHIDSYSGFYDNGHRKSTGLGEWLQTQNVTEIYVLGLAQDYCVQFTVLDALQKFGLQTTLLTDATRPVELEAGDGTRALQRMEAAGAQLRTSQEAITMLNTQA